MNYKNISKQINYLNQEIASSENITETSESFINEYSNAKNNTEYVLLDLNKNLKPDIVNYSKLVKNNIALCNTILNKLEKLSK
ncbi:hypothetical protein CPAV1605_886 [seawater metagenome]|uniref:Uncharacterized protein n=1 Tax=seawater metagenome TaxID=1561972 RepID=A0A5E8CIV6_9ZZZZ